MQKIKTENPQYYDGIDIFKFAMAIFIVILHTHPFYGIHEGLNFITADVLGRTAVPFFFAASGFLLQKKINFGNAGTTETKGIIKSYICRILKLYLIWTAIYLPIIIYSKIICSERGIKYGIFATLRDFVFSGSYAHLWYLPATAVGVILVFLLKKVLGTRKTGIILLLLFAAGLLAQSYFGLLPMIVEENGVIWNILKLIKKGDNNFQKRYLFRGVIYISGNGCGRLGDNMESHMDSDRRGGICYSFGL